MWAATPGETHSPPPSGLVIPIVIWGKTPPKHKITTVRLLSDRATVVTGGENGHVIVWKLQVDALCPHLLLVGHGSAITALSSASLSSNSARFISASEDGQLCLWDWLDGRCIDNVVGSHVHRQMQPLSFKSSSRAQMTRLVCSGDYNDFLVLDPQDLTPVFSISSRVDADKIMAFSLMKRSNRAEQLLGVSANGILKVWSLMELDKKDATNPLFDDELRRLDLSAVNTISFSQVNEKIALIVSMDSWRIIDLDDFSVLGCYKTTSPATWGQVMEVDKIAIAYLDGSVRIFQMPLKSLNGAQIISQFGPNRQNYFNMDQPFEIAILEGKKASVNATKLADPFVFSFSLQKDDITAWQVIRASFDGDLLSWLVPRYGSTFIERVSSLDQLPLKYKGTFCESLDAIWQALNETPNSPLSELDQFEVTTSLYVASQGKLLLGRTNGDIVMTYACDTLSRQLLDINQERQNPRILHGHAGAVRALIYPFEHSSRFDVQVLLSGGDDFSVIVWNINTAVRLYKFSVHGGPVMRFVVPPANCSKQTLKCIGAISSDNAVALLNIRDMKCTLLASRHPCKVIDVKWRPLDDYMLIRLENGHIYIWQIETASIERIVSGPQGDDIFMACDEQIGVAEGSDEAGATQAVQLIRALKHRNIDAAKRVGAGSGPGSSGLMSSNRGGNAIFAPMSVQTLPKSDSGAHIILFEVASLIYGLTSIDAVEDTTSDPKSISQLMSKSESQDTAVAGLSRRLTWQFESNLYLDIARLLLSCLHAWELDADLDAVCLKKLGLHKPKHQLFYGNLSRQGYMAVVIPARTRSSFSTFATDIRWQASHSLTTIHLLSVISTANTLMSMRNSSLQLNRRKSNVHPLKRTPSKDSMSGERQQMKQGWSLLAAMHCVMLPDNVRPKSSYAAPRIELLARRWQDGCLEIREAAQALLIRELNRLGVSGRKRLIESWAPFLPTLLDPSLSIFGTRQSINPMAPSTPMLIATTQAAPPPIPPRSNRQPLPQVPIPEPSHVEESDNGVQQVRRNQATSIILLGVVGSEFGEELNKAELTRATAISLLELLVSPPSTLLPVHSPLRRAAIDLLGRGFVQWEPHLEISKVLLGLLDLAANAEKHSTNSGQLSPLADACRTARHALSLIANARPPAMLTALSMEVARYNAAAQHQTIQHTVVSPLLKSRTEVLRIIEELSDKQYVSMVEMMLPVGDVLVHCLDTSLLKHKTLAEVFPPITRFYMIGYCATTRRIAFGGRNGICIVHELRSAKAQSLQAHQGPVAAVAFSEDGKYLATYGSQDGKINFWQTSQSFLGMGQSQMRCTKTLAAPALPSVLSPGGQSFRSRLVWINTKALTLMLPEGREQRFTV
ncbi:unnamed protein product, partial [Mesorhabditis belari]|uniref:WD repeat-containing protein 7 n=1 Tax=Mesorhabditis belari TaxID=2138241 RepID=A0AAF3E876_9BILA